MTALRVGGLCEGYSGLFMALAGLLPVEHAWYAEIDTAASEVLAHHYPSTPNLGDITVVDWAEVARAGRADGGLAVLTAGWPCQPFSLSGPRRGSADLRHLWPIGVKPAIEALTPSLFIGENVPGLLTIENGQVFAKVLADLDDLGYTVSWTTVGACKVGACHHRHRVFIAATLTDVRAPLSDPVAHRAGAGWGPAQSVLFGDVEAVRWPPAGFTTGGVVWEMPSAPCGAGDSAVLPTPRTSDTNGAGQHGDGGTEVQPTVAMLPTPTVTNWHGNHTNGRGEPLLPGAVAMMPTPRASDADKGGPNQRGSSGDVMLPAAVQPGRFGKYAAAVARHEVAFGRLAPDPTVPGRNGKPRLAPAFPEWMMGLPAGWLTDVVDRKAALKLAGNGVVPQAAAYALPLLPTFRAAVAALTASAGVTV